MKTYIETDRLILRDWRDDDKQSFARINADPMIMEFFPRQLKEDESDRLVERFKKHISEHGFGFYAMELKKSGEFMGFAGLEHVDTRLPFSPAVEIAWRLDYGFWGSGYGTEAANAVLEHGFTDAKLREIVGYAVHDNTRALKLMEKIGMHRDPKGDFEYPALPKGHPLADFVLYRITGKQYQS